MGSSWDQRYARALGCSRSEGIDLASAYSVLLEIMSLEQAKSIFESLSPAAKEETLVLPEPGQPPGIAGEEFEELTYDQGFYKAVAAGYLTIRQASERGDRVVYASRLAQKHNLPMNLAFLVTDGRTSLTEALKQANKKEQEGSRSETQTQPAEASAFPGRFALSLLLGAMILLGGWGAWRALREETEATPRAMLLAPRRGPAPAVTTATEVRRNLAGELTSVRALDPKMVLEAYCRSGRGVIRHAVRVASDDDDTARGIFRQDGELYTIPIHRDAATAHWSVGNEFDPIVPEPARMEGKK